MHEDEKAGIEKFAELAKQGHINSMFELGSICERLKNFGQALRWYVLVFQAEWLRTGQHHLQALNSLDQLRNKGESKKIKDVKDFDKCFKQFLRHHALNQNRTMSCYTAFESIATLLKTEKHLTGRERQVKSQWLINYYYDHYATPDQCYQKGTDCVRDNNYDAACFYLLKAKDHSDALTLLATCYKEGRVGRVDNKPNLEEAARLYLQANTPKALNSLACLYLEGTLEARADGTPNNEKAATILRRVNNPEALLMLGAMYRDGSIGAEDGKPNLEEVARIFEQSGHPEALYELGFLYHYRKINVENEADRFELAAQCYEKAATPAAKCCLGKLYGLGRIRLKDGNPDKETAKKLLQASHHPEALCALGMLYLEGSLEEINGKPNYLKAYLNFANSDTAWAVIMQLYMIELWGEELKNRQHPSTQDLCTKLKGLITKEEQYIKEYSWGVLAFHLENDLNKALLHFNNAFVLGHFLAKDQIDKIQKLLKLEEEEVSNRLEQAPVSAPNHEEIVQKNAAAAVVSIITPEMPRAPAAQTMIPEVLDEERPAQYKPARPLLSREDRLKQIQDKINSRMRTNVLKSFDLNNKDDKKPLAALSIKYINQTVNEQFSALAANKVTELLDAIDAKSYATEGPGKPEVLKGKFHGYKGCLSRRIDHTNRLVYKVIGPREILILACQGHY